MPVLEHKRGRKVRDSVRRRAVRGGHIAPGTQKFYLGEATSSLLRRTRGDTSKLTMGMVTVAARDHMVSTGAIIGALRKRGIYLKKKSA